MPRRTSLLTEPLRNILVKLADCITRLTRDTTIKTIGNISLAMFTVLRSKKTDPYEEEEWEDSAVCKAAPEEQQLDSQVP
jgi:hypothetical protein